MGNWKSREKKDKNKSKKANITHVKEVAYPKFHEYLSSAGKTVERAPTEKVADYNGPRPSRPQKSGSWLEDADRKGRKKGVGTPSPYSAPGSDPGQKKGEHGFGDEGPKELIYNPGTDVSGTKDQEKNTWPKNTKIESFLSATRSMSTEEYANLMRDRTTHGGLEYEAVRYIATNPITLTALVREVRRKGNLEALLEALLEIPDAHKILVETLAINPRFQRALSRAMDDNVIEAVGPPMHRDDEEDEDEEPTPEGGAHDSLDDMEPEDDDEDEDEDDDEHDEDDDYEDEDPIDDEPMDDEDDEDDEPSDDLASEPHERHPVPPHLRDKLRRFMQGL